MLLVLPLTLTACGGLIKLVGVTNPPILVDPPVILVQSCKEPILLPDRGLTQAEVESYWINDRENLIRCDLQLQELIEFYSVRDKGIAE